MRDGARVDITATDRKLIAEVPHFSDLPPETLQKVVAGGAVFSYPRGTVLFQQGEKPECLHIVLEGEVGLLGERGGEETVVEILQPGEMFLAAAVLTDRPYLMTAKVLKPARLLLLGAPDFRRHLREEPDLAIAMLAAVSRHFRGLVREVKDLKLKSSAQRLGDYLLALVEGRQGRQLVRLPHAKSVIAARIGIRPETLSRHFAMLQDVGVWVRGNQVEITDVGRLAAFCRPSPELVE